MEQCLCSVLKACNRIEAEVIVVDNNSGDGSRDFFAGRFPGVRFLWKKENMGFAKANNEGISLARGEKILFLNPDTILPEDCLEKCLQVFGQHAKTGALGVRMFDGAGNYLPESKRGFPTAFASFCKMSGLTSLFPASKLFARYYLGHLPMNKSHEADVISGAFMMIEKKLIDRVGGFDEDYFMYAEDIDLSYRIQKAGYKNFYYADTAIIHFKGESTSRQSAAYLENFYGTMLLFVQKHYSRWQGGLYIFFLKMLIGIKKRRVQNAAPHGNKTLAAKANVLADESTYEKLKRGLHSYFSETSRIEKTAEVENEEAIIFCEPSLSFKEMIDILQLHPNRNQFFIHAAGSASVVGSSDKNQPGIVLEC